MNLPNKLTVLRIILTPIFMLTLVWSFPFHYAVSLLIFIAASITDLLDGKIARKKLSETELNKHWVSIKGPIAKTIVRTNGEHLSKKKFEKFCERCDSIEWFYKNGDAGQQYLSIVYTDALQKQWLFYPDYIVQKENGETWLIETKGGEVSGHSKNIDMQMGNKFLAFKRYAEQYGLKWGFVRDEDEQLYINNTEFAESMSDEHWVAIEEEF